ncbi:hypothetical protein [Streptomyces sp. SBT349]|uniref:hypothetical protein n=1 Tax=Streptomyces sp. SBT349 TaxID=1580539 RepID=UPI00131D3597|nr:hypothetical protein [Streptomyces sp. SBT349]
MSLPPQQPGPWGGGPDHGRQPGPYPPQQAPGGYGQPGPYGGEPPKSRNGLIVAIVAIAVLLLGGGAIYLLTEDDEPTSGASQDPSDSPEPSDAEEEPPPEEEPTDDPGAGGGGGSDEDLLAVAQDYVNAVNAADEAAATALMCGQTDPGGLYSAVAGSATVVTVGEITSSDGTEAFVELIIGSQPPLPSPFDFTDGSWCVRF